MMRRFIKSPVDIPPDAMVLVTNGTQPVPLQVIKQLLERGCRVRAATTWIEDASWLDVLFAPYLRLGKFERVMLGPGHPEHRAFYQDVVKSVHAIVHSATLPRLDQPLQEVWELAARSVVCMLEAAEHEPSVKAIVYTSSIVAAAPHTTPSDLLVTEDSWNVKDTILALTGQCGMDVVRNSALVRAEQALWHWASEQCPGFKINVVSPSNLIGQNFGAEHTTDWRNWIWRLYRYGHARGVIPGAGPTQAHWYVDVEDVALLHIAAIFDPEVSGYRLQAWGCFRDWNDAITSFQNHENGKKLYSLIGDDGVTRGQLYTKFERVSGIFLRWKGRRCWKEFEDTLAESVEVFRGRDRPRTEYRDMSYCDTVVSPNGWSLVNGDRQGNGNGLVNGNGLLSSPPMVSADTC